MKYATAKAFRRALETRIHAVARGDPAALIRMRRTVVYDRLLARLFSVSSGGWIVKGGYALDIRLGERARATRDLDLARVDSAESAATEFSAAAAIDLNDFFEFFAKLTGTIDTENEEPVVRMSVRAELDGRRFETVSVDIGFRDAFPTNLDLLTGHELLAFADLDPITVPVIPLELHLAEKLHAYARRYSNERLNTRVKDLVDIVLISSTSEFNASSLRHAIEQTFRSRGTQSLPSTLPLPPGIWTTPYRTLALEVGRSPVLDDGFRQAARFFDHVLADAGSESVWNPSRSEWVNG